jgi:allophanate hydrolase subunit 1
LAYLQRFLGYLASHDTESPDHRMLGIHQRYGKVKAARPEGQFDICGRGIGCGAGMRVIDPQEFPPTLIRPGDYVQCPAVSEEEARLAGQRHLGEFVESYQDH